MTTQLSITITDGLVASPAATRDLLLKEAVDVAKAHAAPFTATISSGPLTATIAKTNEGDPNDVTAAGLLVEASGLLTVGLTIAGDMVPTAEQAAGVQLFQETAKSWLFRYSALLTKQGGT